MTPFAIVAADGTILFVLSTSDPTSSAVADNTPEGCTAIRFDGDPNGLAGRFRYDFKAEAFVALPADDEPPRRLLSFNEWVDRFSFEAQAGIMAATASDPMAKLIYDRAMSAGTTGSIDPQDPRTAEGVQYLVSQGYIAQADADGALAP